MPPQKKRAPLTLPADKPPELEGKIVDGRRTPTYVLAWVCDDLEFYKNLSKSGKHGHVTDLNCTGVVKSRYWAVPYNCGYGLSPIPYPGPDNKTYLIAMFNQRYANHLERIRNMAEDPVINAARIAMGVNEDPTLEETFRWYRWPLGIHRIIDSDEGEAALGAYRYPLTPLNYSETLGAESSGKSMIATFPELSQRDINWATPNCGGAFRPLAFPGPGGDFYLIAMWNRANAEPATQRSASAIWRKILSSTPQELRWA